MPEQLITINPLAVPQSKQAAVLVVAAAFVLAVGSVAIAAVVICGWRGAKQVVMDFLRGKATFVCR